MSKEKKLLILENEQSDLIREAVNKIVIQRNTVYEKTGIDILDTDNMKSSQVQFIVEQYDQCFQTNWKRNGIDAISKKDRIEVKNASLPNLFKKRTGEKHLTGWQFHALHHDDYNRFIGVVWDKKNHIIDRLYDIKDQNNLDTIKSFLQKQTDIWREKVNQDPNKAIRDVIVLDESLVQKFSNLNTLVLKKVNIFKDF